MGPYATLDITQRERVLEISIRWPSPHGTLSSAVLDDFDVLFNWLEDEKPCDILVFLLGSESGVVKAPPPDMDDCQRWEKLVLRIERFAGLSVAVLDGMSLVSIDATENGPVVTLIALPDEHVRLVGPDGQTRWLFVARPLDPPEVDAAQLN